jgi:hypothetical protein
MGVSKAQKVPVNVVGSSSFGRYPKISLEKTYNMFISDEWLVNYAGYQRVSEIVPTGEGRGIFHSVRGNFLLVVVSSSVYRVGLNLAPHFIGNISTNTGDVFMDENLSQQICIVDGQDAYIFHYPDNTLTQQTLTFLGNPIIPNYVCYHNTFFLIASSPFDDNPQNWYAFEYATDSTIQLNTQFSLQTKPDSALAVKRLPGRGNNVIVFGSTVAEVWTQVGGDENYRRVQSFNIDNGVVAASTIAASEELVCWLAQNENNSPSIMVTDGASSRRISTDGIDYLLQTLKRPDKSTAFFFRQDGHLFWQVTFFDSQDNLSLIYDFNTNLFFHVSNEDLNFHPARRVVYFNEKTLFVSIRDASIYQMGTEFITYNYNIDPTEQGDVIPRIRICKSIRLEDSERFRVGQFTFWIEQGVNDFYFIDPDNEFCNGLLITETGGNFIVSQQGENILGQVGECAPEQNPPRVDLSFSKNGNQSFSNIVSRELNINGHYRNQIRWWRMGQANEWTPQLRFWGFQRFVAQNGVAEVIV